MSERVKLRITIEADVEWPHHGDAGVAKSYWEEGTRCVDNPVLELMEENPCLCEVSEIEFLGLAEK